MKYDVGIIGGGQLALMLCEEAKRRGKTTICLDEYDDAPAFKVCDDFLVGKFSDEIRMTELAEKSQVVLYEFENINLELVSKLSKKYNIYQGERPLKYSRHRVLEKTFALKNGLAVPRFFSIQNKEQLYHFSNELGFPCVIKSATEGYDGKGQMVIRRQNDLESVPEKLLKDAILEEFVKYDFETSLILCRNKCGEIATLPICENIHKNGILDICVFPSKKLSSKMQEKIIHMGKEFIENADFYGILAIEFFVRGDEVLFNEMAPRPHNSGHHSIESATKSQYALFLDCALGEPLEDSRGIKKAVMKNILGEDVKNMEKLEKNENTFIHWYHKSENKVGRKMAHVTFTDMEYDEFLKLNKEIFEDYNE